MSVAQVLIIDDSVLVRKVVTTALEQVQGIDVLGTASNGRIGLQRIEQMRPNVVVLDIEMPEMDGLETLAKIREKFPTLPVIMFSTLSEHGVRSTLEALERGANECVAKPSGTGALDETLEYIKIELGRRILALTVPRPSIQPAPRSDAKTTLPPRSSPRRGARPRVVAIGTSTGGPQALAELLSRLPHDFPVPIVITQHMPPLFTKFLAERLSVQSERRVLEAEAGMKLEPGLVLLAPGDFHLLVERAGDGTPIVRLSSAPPENSCRPAVDPMLRSLVPIFGPEILAVILTGMGKDGSSGAEFVVEAGGSVLVQDEKSSVVWGMPGFVARAGLAELVLPLDELASEVTRRVLGPRNSSLAVQP